jgi:CIC family chloride channel protein
VEVLQAITVGEVMQADIATLHESASLQEAAAYFAQSHRHGMAVVNDSGDLVGIFTLQDLDLAMTHPKEARRIGDVCERNLEVTYPDETIGAALQRMAPRDLGRLPVVARENPRKLLGVLRRSDGIRAYQLALTRRATLRHRAHQVRLDSITPDLVDVTEIVLEPGSPLIGRLMKDIPWPRECVIASLRRGQRVLIPRGDTALQVGDVLVAVVEEAASPRLVELCAPQEPPHA